MKARVSKKFLSLLLALYMVLTMLPSTVFAEAGAVDSGTPLGISGEITAFEELDEDVSAQTVAAGTTEGDLDLPKALTVTVTTGPTATETDSEAQDNVAAVAVSCWESEPEFDGNRVEIYTFTPTLALPDGLTVAEGITPPQISVTVEAPAAPAPVLAAELFGMAPASENFDGIPADYLKRSNPDYYNGWIIGVLKSDGAYDESAHIMIGDETSGSALSTISSDHIWSVQCAPGAGKTIAVKSADGSRFNLHSFHIESGGDCVALKVTGYRFGSLVSKAVQSFLAPAGADTQIALSDTAWQDVAEFRIERQDGQADIPYLYLDDISISEAVTPPARVPPIITTDLNDKITSAGTYVMLDATATVTDGGRITYEWFSNTTRSKTGAKLLNVWEPTYYPDVSAAGTTYYYCTVTNWGDDYMTGIPAWTTSAIAAVTVNPKLAGTVTIPNEPYYGQMLIPNTDELRSIPAGSLGALFYEWKIEGNDTPVSSKNFYVLDTCDIGKTITVTVTAANCAGSITSKPTNAVTKANHVIPPAPTVSSKTATTVTLGRFGRGTLYRMGSGAWQENTTFTGLTPNMTYTFYAKYPEDDIFFESPESPPLTVTTNKADLRGSVSIIGTMKYGDILTAAPTLTSDPVISDIGALSYSWQQDHVAIIGADSVSYTLTTDDIGKTITVAVTAENCGGYVISAATAPVEKLDGPAAPALTSVTYTGDGSTFTCTVKSIPNAEYKMDSSGAWQDSNVFTGIEPLSPHVFFARIKETDTHKAGEPGGIDIIFSKLVGPAVPAVTGSYVASGDTFTYTVDPIPGAEYGISGIGGFQDSNVFTGITPLTAYNFYARIKETATHEAGLIVLSDVVNFLKLYGRPAPTLGYTISEGDFPKTISIMEVVGAEYSFNGGDFSSMRTYTSNSAETVTLAIRLAETATHRPSPYANTTVNTANQDQPAPDAFALTYVGVNDISFTVTIPVTAGAEYSFDGTNWSITNTKTGCMPGETITGYKRMAAKPGYNASPTTSASAVLPLFQVKMPMASPSG